MKVLLTSTSPIKLAALKSFLDPKTTIKCVAVDCGNPEQPVGKTGGLLCCKQRILHVIKSQDVSEFGCIFSIENAIEEENGCCYDVVHILRFKSV
jgi:non-canonical (house-cleaning) NTP pyrophosphatase